MGRTLTISAQKWPGKKCGIHIGRPVRIWVQKQPAKKCSNTSAFTLGTLSEFGHRHKQLKNAATPAQSYGAHSDNLNAEIAR